MNARIVVLSGSTRFREDFERIAEELTLEGVIILMPHVWLHAQPVRHVDEATKFKLDELHLRKIDLADEVLVVNPGGYIGASTSNEIAYAKGCGKVVRYTDQHALRPEPKTADLYE